MIASGNPTLRDGVFGQVGDAATPQSKLMTVSGTIGKTVILLVILAAAAAWVWYIGAQAASGIADPQQAASAMLGATQFYIFGGMIGGLVLAVITIFKKTAAPITAPIYAALEGLFIGGISVYINTLYQGVVFQAVICTMGVLFTMLILYQLRIIRPTKKFVMGVVAATGGIMIFYVVAFIAAMFGATGGAFSVLSFSNGSAISIGFSVIVVVIAALNLVIDFGAIESGAQQGAPKYMEWYGAFALMVTLIWLYIEILRLLSKLQNR